MSFRLGKTQISVSYALICAMALFLLVSKLNGFFCCIAAVIIHESGHLLAMRALGFTAEKITISLFEISICDRQRQERTLKQNLIIIFFGPAANFICFIVCFVLYLYGINGALPFGLSNLSVGAFNSLPVISLDGGQLLYLLLRQRYSSEVSQRIVTAATVTALIPLSVCGFLILIDSVYNFSLLFVCGYILASLILKNNRFY